MVYLDGTGEALAGMLRAGSAGSNTAADHLGVVDQALARLPVPTRADDPDGGEWMLLRADSASATRAFVDGLRQRGIEFSIGFPLTEDVRHAVLSLPERAWTGSMDQTCGLREAAECAEVTHLLDFPPTANPNPGVYAVDDICLFVGEGGADDCRPASGEDVVSFVVPCSGVTRPDPAGREWDDDPAELPARSGSRPSYPTGRPRDLRLTVTPKASFPLPVVASVIPPVAPDPEPGVRSGFCPARPLGTPKTVCRERRARRVR